MLKKATTTNETKGKSKKTRRSNGEGSVTQRKDGTYMGRVSVGWDKNGNPKRHAVYGKTVAEVREKMVKIQHEMNTGIYIEPNRMNISEWMDIWLEEYKKSSVRPSTFVSYEMNTRRHIKPHIGKLLLKDLRPDHIQKMYNTLLKSGHEDGISGLSPKTIRNIHNALHEALQQAMRNGIVMRNVSEAVTLPRRSKPQMRVLSVEEQEQFLKTLEGDRLEMAFRLDLSTGLRMGELLALSWNDVDLSEGVIRVVQSLNRIKNFDDNSTTKTSLVFQETKTQSGQRSIPLPEPIIEDLKIHKQKQQEELELLGLKNKYNLVLTSEAGTPIDPRSFIRKFHNLINKAGLEHANVHSMRHTFATRLLEANEHAKVVQEMMGHSSISLTLDIYSHVLPDKKKSAAAKLTKLFERKPEESNKIQEPAAPYLALCS